jgi:PAS domain S-box-containing protein
MARVLITDDNWENRYMLEVLLKNNGFETVSAANGKEALESARARPPDLIVADILMPVMDGFTLCEQWKADERLKHVPFVFYTATYTDTRDIELGLNLGADRFLIKPMETEALLQALREVLAGLGTAGQSEPERPFESEMEILKQYNGSLFRKLEKKMADLETINRRFQEEIKERQMAEKSVRQAEEKLKTLLDTLPVGLAWANTEKRMQYANRKFTELFGYTLEDLPTLRDWFLLAQPDREAGERLYSTWAEAIVAAGHTGEAAPPVDVRVRCKNGVLRDVSLIGARITDLHVAIFTDITERTQLHQQLLQAQKLENIGNLAGGIAHDFNNVLTTVTGFAGLLQMSMQQSDPRMHYVKELAAAGMRGAALTHQLLAFSRKQILDTKPIDLNKTMAILQKMLGRLIREDIALTFRPFGEPLPVMADANQIEQVVINLVTNARDAMPHGGPLDISTGIADIDEAFVRGYGYGVIGRYGVIAISDGGVGMDDETKRSIFEPFFTTKETDKGTGLGLAVVYGIIRQHKGMIRVESAPGKGSVFTVYLPLLEEDREVLEPQEEELSFMGGSETLLVAEDNEMLRNMTKDTLEGAGYRVIVAEDGRAAVALFREHRVRIALLIFDLVMPGKRGLEAYEEIRKEVPGMKALFVTGYAESDVEREEIDRRNLPLLMKPYRPGEFLAKVRELLDGDGKVLSARSRAPEEEQ